VFLDDIKDGRIKVDGNTVLVVDETAQLAPSQFIEPQRLWMQHGTILRARGNVRQSWLRVPAGASLNSAPKKFQFPVGPDKSGR